jgi:FkbM family methyltransferase
MFFNFLKKIFVALTNSIAKKNEAIKQHFYRLEKAKKWETYFKNTDDIVYNIEDGIKIHLNRNSRLTEFILFQHFEENEINFLNKFLKDGDIVFEIGANIGLHALHEAKAVGNSGKVFAFEPVPSTYNTMLANLKLNAFNNIATYNVGLSNNKGQLEMNVSSNYDAWNTLVDQSKMVANTNIYDSKIYVDLIKLDDFMMEENIDLKKISLLKIDVEGWEKFVLLGGSSFLKNESPVLMIEFDENNTWAAGYLCHELYDLLVSFGYEIFTIVDGKLKAEPKQLHYPSQNLIAIKNDGNFFRTRISFSA